MLVIPRKSCLHKVRCNSKSQSDSKFATRSTFTMRSIFSTAGSFGYHPCKNGTHNTSFYNTRGHTPTLEPAIVGVVTLVAFHPQPQIASNLGRSVTRSSNPHRNRKQFPSGNDIFALWPQIQIASGLNPLRFESRKPNPPLYVYFLSSLGAQTAKTFICSKSAVSADSRKGAQKLRKTTLSAQFLHKKGGFAHFWHSFWNRRKPHFFCRLIFLPFGLRVSTGNTQPYIP